jgi:hypothetical protein
MAVLTEALLSAPPPVCRVVGTPLTCFRYACLLPRRFIDLLCPRSLL